MNLKNIFYCLINLFFCTYCFLLLLNYNCPSFSLVVLPCPSHIPTTPTVNPYPVVLVHGSSILFLNLTIPLLSLVILLSLSLWSLSVCFLFPRLWFYFAHLFVLLIRVHLWMTPYGIFLSPSGLFHLA